MAQGMIRQIGVVIGLTVILTFPVTVVSGAGSQKHREHSVRAIPIGSKVIAGVEAHTTSGSWSGRQELPR
jgi:hypothetical protein